MAPGIPLFFGLQLCNFSFLEFKDLGGRQQSAVGRYPSAVCDAFSIFCEKEEKINEPIFVFMQYLGRASKTFLFYAFFNFLILLPSYSAFKMFFSCVATFITTPFNLTTLTMMTLNSRVKKLRFGVTF
jgi:hypothetical protein